MRKQIGASFLAVVVAAVACAAQAPARPLKTIDWYEHGVWLKADFHMHSRFTDGAHTIDEIVENAVKNGCAAVAITDHADDDLKGGTPEYAAAIAAARTRFPGITILTGMEWNVPPGKGQEHATVLFPAAMESAATLGAFKAFDDLHKEGENPELALRGLAALKPADARGVWPAMFFNHPNRSPRSTSHPTLTYIALQKAAPEVLIGFEGAPGHQRTTPPGGPLDARWDPLVATVGGVWDQWLQQGVDVWAALANSDFHQEAGDFWPCEFAATWVYAPDRTPDGIIKAIHAGSFFAEHGHSVQEVELQARFAGVSHVFRPGESAQATRGAEATVSLTMKTADADYRGDASAIAQVELIGTSAAGSQVLFAGPPAGEPAFSVKVPVPEGGIVLRARGRRTTPSGDLLFYTNPIRLVSR